MNSDENFKLKYKNIGHTSFYYFFFLFSLKPTCTKGKRRKLNNHPWHDDWTVLTLIHPRRSTTTNSNTVRKSPHSPLLILSYQLYAYIVKVHVKPICRWYRSLYDPTMRNVDQTPFEDNDVCTLLVLICNYGLKFVKMKSIKIGRIESQTKSCLRFLFYFLNHNIKWEDDESRKGLVYGKNSML